MKQPTIRSRHGPEWKIQNNLIKYLIQRGWLVERMIGNAYQKGIPDLFVSHPKFGQRWIDVKNPVTYTFTRAQKKKSGPCGKNLRLVFGF